MNFLKRCWRRDWIRRWMRRSVGALCILLVLIGLLWAWVDWKGARRWRDTQAMLAKGGQTLDFRAVAPDPIPDAENFCAIPLLKDLALVIDDDADKGELARRRERLSSVELPSSFFDERRMAAGSTLGERADLKEWSARMRKEHSSFLPPDSGNAARDALAGLSRWEPVFKELAAGLDRPRAQWTPAWKTREMPRDPFKFELPHLWSTLGLRRLLALRGIAAAQAGDIAKADESARIMARFSEASLEEPCLHALEGASYWIPLLAGVTWELCDAQAGSAEDFRRLESSLAGLDFRQAIWRSYSNELVYGVSGLQFARNHPGECPVFFQPMDNSGKPLPSFVFVPARAFPSGFFDANAAVLADLEFTHLVKPMRDGGWQAEVASARKLQEELQRRGRDIAAHPSHIITHSSYLVTFMFAPFAEIQVSRAFYAQTLANQAVIACALERYRIEKGSYPESLAEVSLADGQPLPLDMMTGKPLSYSRTPNGKYALWSVAFNGKDHGGRRLLDEKYPKGAGFWHEDYPGDWVWDFPEK